MNGPVHRFSVFKSSCKTSVEANISHIVVLSVELGYLFLKRLATDVDHDVEERHSVALKLIQEEPGANRDTRSINMRQCI